MLTDTFIPSQGFNNNFSYLKNFEVSQSPIEEGSKSEKFFFTKKAGFFSATTNTGAYKREMEGEYVGKEVFNDICYVWDSLGKVYSFEKDSQGLYELTKVYDNGDSLIPYTNDEKGNSVVQRCLKINYIADKQSDRTVLSSTNTGGGGSDVELVVNEAGTFNITDVGSYIYITADATSDYRFQVRLIIDVIDEVTVHLSEQFYNEPIVGEPGQTYAGIEEVLVFNNLKNTNGQVLTYEPATGNTELRYLGGKDIGIYDGRFWNLTMSGTSVVGSLLTGEYEIPDIDTIFGDDVGFRGETILSIKPYKTYLLLFYKTSIAVVRQIGSDGSGNPVYNYNEILGGVGLFSANSYIIKEGSLYIFTQTKIVNGLEIKPQSTNIIEGVLVPQGYIIQKQLNEILKSDYVELFDYDVGIGILASNDTGTKIHKYSLEYQGWYYHESKNTLSNYFGRLYSDGVIGYSKYICIEGGESDFGEDIDQEVHVIGPGQTYGDAFTIIQIKILLGFFDNNVDFTMELDLGGEKFIGDIKDNANGISYVRRQNIAAANGALSQVPLSYMVLGGINSVKDGIGKIGLVGLRVGKSGVYYQLRIKNKDNKNFNFGSIMVQYKEGNPLLVPMKNIT